MLLSRFFFIVVVVVVSIRFKVLNTLIFFSHSVSSNDNLKKNEPHYVCAFVRIPNTEISFPIFFLLLLINAKPTNIFLPYLSDSTHTRARVRSLAVRCDYRFSRLVTVMINTRFKLIPLTRFSLIENHFQFQSQFTERERERETKNNEQCVQKCVQKFHWPYSVDEQKTEIKKN